MLLSECTFLIKYLLRPHNGVFHADLYSHCPYDSLTLSEFLPVFWPNPFSRQLTVTFSTGGKNKIKPGFYRFITARTQTSYFAVL